MILNILCILALFPAFYPLSLLIKKRDVNLFDFIILFHTLNFVVSPLIYGYRLNLDEGIVYDEFFYYISFILVVLAMSAFWHEKYEDNVSIINVTKFIGGYNSLNISLLGRILLFVAIVVSLVFYLPRATYILHSEDYTPDVDYQAKSLVAVWGTIWSLLGIVFSMSLVLSYKNKIYNKIDLFMSISYFVMLVFFPRRFFLLGILFLFVVLYSIYREAITKKLLGLAASFGIVFYLIYFPFYNVMRNSNFIFDSNHPIESLYGIVSNAVDNWNYRNTDESAAGATSNRSLGLYTALYDLIKNNPDPKNGELTYEAIDVSLPKVINPHKGDGPEPTLEKMTKRYIDQADSFLLHSYGELHYWGFIFAALLYLFIFCLYNAYSKIWQNIFQVNLVPFYISFLMISLVWNVEGGVNSNFSWFFTSLITLIVIYIVEHFEIIKLK